MSYEYLGRAGRGLWRPLSQVDSKCRLVQVPFYTDSGLIHKILVLSVELKVWQAVEEAGGTHWPKIDVNVGVCRGQHAGWARRGVPHPERQGNAGCNYQSD
jgi:hypothetical protein